MLFRSPECDKQPSTEPDTLLLWSSASYHTVPVHVYFSCSYGGNPQVGRPLRKEELCLKTEGNRARDTIANLRPCTTVLEGGKSFGDFIEWTVQHNDCLININTALALALNEFRSKDQPIPRWILEDPDVEDRQQMTDSFTNFGYPFVNKAFRAG